MHYIIQMYIYQRAKLRYSELQCNKHHNNNNGGTIEVILHIMLHYYKEIYTLVKCVCVYK